MFLLFFFLFQFFSVVCHDTYLSDSRLSDNYSYVGVMEVVGGQQSQRNQLNQLN